MAELEAGGYQLGVHREATGDDMALTVRNSETQFVCGYRRNIWTCFVLFEEYTEFYFVWYIGNVVSANGKECMSFIEFGETGPT